MPHIHKPSCAAYFDGTMCNSHDFRTICKIKSGLRSEGLLRKKFQVGWTAQGSIEKTSSGDSTYVTVSSLNAAILVVHDLSGWTFPNIRLDYWQMHMERKYVPDL